MTAVPRATDRWLLVVRPRRVTIICAVSAVVVLVAMIVVGILLQRADDGVSFRATDQIGLIGVGIVVAAAIMTGARPRLRADASGLYVRNVLGEAFFEWAVVLRVAFPEGSHWAQLLLADDETYPVTAIQAMDRQRAVDALRQIRALHTQYAPSGSEITARALEVARAREEAEAAARARRQPGRLEVIDQEKAAKSAKPAQPPRSAGDGDSRASGPDRTG